MKWLGALAARPRVVLIGSMLLSRAAGFFNSLVLARTIGVDAVGVYSAVLSSAANVVSPITGVVQNTSTAMAAGDQVSVQQRDEQAAALLVIAAGVCSLSALAFFALMHAGLKQAALDPVALIAGVCWIVGNLCFGAVQGRMFGEGRFVPVATTVGAVSLIAMLLCVPAILSFGLDGALALTVFTSLAPLLLLGPRMLDWRRVRGDNVAKVQVLRQLRAGMPTAAAAGLNNATNWFCFIYLAQRYHGFEGVGLLAIANQWLALMLIPSTSWGSITLRGLVQAAEEGRPAVRQALRRFAMKDLGATAVIWIAVAALSVPLSHAYGARGQGLALLLCAAGLVAQGTAMCMVFERAFMALHVQGAWFFCSASGLAVQTLATLALIEHGPWAVLVGVSLGYAVQQSLCWIVFWRASR